MLTRKQHELLMFIHERIKEQEHPLLVRAVSDLVTRTYRIDGRKVVWT